MNNVTSLCHIMNEISLLSMLLFYYEEKVRHWFIVLGTLELNNIKYARTKVNIINYVTGLNWENPFLGLRAASWLRGLPSHRLCCTKPSGWISPSTLVLSTLNILMIHLFESLK